MMLGDVTLACWHATWRGLGAGGGDEALFHRLIASYSEPHRHYHTLQHLRECLGQFDAAQALAQRPSEVAVALWFHDAVYDPRRRDNEQRSADWAHQAMLDADLPLAMAARVRALVMDTLHEATPEGEDARLLVDADLAILGAPAERFDESDEQIRREYAHVPDAQFREGRTWVLAGFLARHRIYNTERFHGAYETQARINIKRSLARLAAQP